VEENHKSLHQEEGVVIVQAIFDDVVEEALGFRVSSEHGGGHSTAEAEQHSPPRWHEGHKELVHEVYRTSRAYRGAAHPTSSIDPIIYSTSIHSAVLDVDIPRVTKVEEDNTPININHGPITRSRAKKLQQEVNSLLGEINFNISENFILPKCSTLVILRYVCERGGAAIHGEEAKKENQVDQFGPRMNQQVQFGQVQIDQFGHVRTCIMI
jgi:hypothetical protein